MILLLFAAPVFPRNEIVCGSVVAQLRKISYIFALESSVMVSTEIIC